LRNFGCHGNSLGSLENLGSIFEFIKPVYLTVHAQNSSISFTELKFVPLWLIFAQIWLP